MDKVPSEPNEKKDPQGAPEPRAIPELPQAEKQNGPAKVHGDKIDVEDGEAQR
jgi:hypothetical protein